MVLISRPFLHLHVCCCVWGDVPLWSWALYCSSRVLHYLILRLWLRLQQSNTDTSQLLQQCCSFFFSNFFTLGHISLICWVYCQSECRIYSPSSRLQRVIWVYGYHPTWGRVQVVPSYACGSSLVALHLNSFPCLSGKWIITFHFVTVLPCLNITFLQINEV